MKGCMRVVVTFSSLLLLVTPFSVWPETADDVVCKKCVESRDIADYSIGSYKLKKDSVRTRKIADQSVTWEKLAVGLQEKMLRLEAKLAELESETAALRAAVSENTVLSLDGYLDLDLTDPGKPTALFAGVNVQVVNGAGQQTVTNGLGNLIVGYDTYAPTDYPYGYICSDGQWERRSECEANGEVWDKHHKSGSHNVVVGSAHRYSQTSGLIAGFGNAVNRDNASVTGGAYNVASGIESSISGGRGNTASGVRSSISGGYHNTARGLNSSSVSGGQFNVASGVASSINGGEKNTASETSSSVSGGSDNTAMAFNSSVSGGFNNTASGDHSSVSGGSGNTAGGLSSSVSGGSGRAANEVSDWAAGSLWEDK